MNDHDERTRVRRGALVTALVFGWEMLHESTARVMRWLSGPGAAGPRAAAFGIAPPEGTGRIADRVRPAEIGQRPHRRRGTLLAGLAYAVGLAGGCLFLVFYWSFDKVHWHPGHNQTLGEMLALFFGGLGVGLVLHAHFLMEHRQAVEQREPMASPGDERDDAYEAFARGEGDVHRRALLVGAGVTGLGLIGAMVVSMLRSFATPPDATLFATVWKRGQRLMTRDGKPVTVDTLTPGNTVVVFPDDSIGSEKSQTVLVRVDPAFLRLPPDRASWAPAGYVAYSRVCTHAGCPVGMFEKTTNLLMCPCHQSTFDVLRAARPTGGPAARSLPQLPLYIAGDGTLRAAGDFSKPPGPGFWGMPS